MSELRIRDADPARDGGACAAIYAPQVEGSAVSFDERAPDAAEMAERIERYAGERGRGVGRALYSSLFDCLRERGFRMAHAGITLPDEASVGLHESLGFERVGVNREIGWKHGAWHDVAWFQMELAPAGEGPPPDPRPG